MLTSKHLHQTAQLYYKTNEIWGGWSDTSHSILMCYDCTLDDGAGRQIEALRHV